MDAFSRLGYRLSPTKEVCLVESPKKFWLPLLLALATLPAADPAVGQLVGVRGGASIASSSTTPGAEIESRVGFAAGVFVELPILQLVAFQAEGAFVQKGAAVSDGSARTTVELNYIELSALLKAGAGGSPSIHFFAGPTVGFNATCRVSAEVGGVTASTGCDSLADDAQLAVKTLDLGVKGGAGVAVQVGESAQVLLEAAYTLGLTEIGDGDGSKNRALLIQAGFVIWVG